MKLHEIRDDFNDLISITADWVGIPESTVYRDYYIVMMLKALEDSEYGENCVFKGGTSLSKCYPGSIERFSEDIDLTYVPGEEISNKRYDRILKQIEKVMSECGRLEKIPQERNDRTNHAVFVSFAPEFEPSVAVNVVIPFGYSSGNAASLANRVYDYIFGVTSFETIIGQNADNIRSISVSE